MTVKIKVGKNYIYLFTYTDYRHKTKFKSCVDITNVILKEQFDLVMQLLDFLDFPAQKLKLF